MATTLENVLENLLVPDNNAIQQATQALKESFKNPSIVVDLCHVITNASNPQVRQYGAVLLRRRMTKKKQWQHLPSDFRQHLRENILLVMIQEQEKTVRNAIVQLVAAVAKHELSAYGWPQLFAFLDQYTKSADVHQRELGLYVLSMLAAAAPEQLKPHLLTLCELFDLALQDNLNKLVQYYAIVTMTEMVGQIGTDEQNKFQLLIPKVLSAIRGLVGEDEEKACEALEIFDELVEADVSVVVPHVKDIVEFCLEIAANTALTDTLRVKAMSFISWLTRLKKKSILKHKLVSPILDVVFPIMCVPHDEGGDGDVDEEDEEDEGAEASTPHSYAGQVIDTMALHLPPEKLIPKLMSLIEPALESANPHHKKAAYLAMAVVVEGCSETIRGKYMKTLLQCVGTGIQASDPIVRNAALFALGQFSEHLQPDISKYASDLIPLLLAYLREGTQTTSSPGADSALSKTFYALEMFCENLGIGILPYLPTLIEQLLAGLSENATVRVRELSISAIAATANAAGQDLVPYFPSIIEPLKTYLNVDCAKEVLPLQIEAFDTLAVISRVIGAQHFLPLTNDCLLLGTQVMLNTEDPDLRRCVYGLMAAISTLLKQDMGPYLSPVVTQMIEAIKSTEGVTVHYDDEEENGFQLFDDDDVGEDIDDDEDEDEEIQGYSVENAYLEEKEDACYALGEIAVNSGTAFMPYLETTYQEIEKLLDHPASIVRKAAGMACAQLCACLALAAEAGFQDASTALLQMIGAVLPRLLTTVREDVDRDVVTETLDAVKLLLDKVHGPVLVDPKHLVAITETVKCVMAQKTACQDADEDVELDDDQAEFDNVLLECAGDIIPSLIKASTGDGTMPFVAGILPDLVKKLKKGASVAERSFAIGTLAEIVEALGERCLPFVDTLYPLALQAAQDSDDEVRSNGVFACGVLAQHGAQKILPHYGHILKLLSDILSRETHPRTLDNICGAVCRMIMANAESVPINQVLPIVLQNMPLKEDFVENETILSCLSKLYSVDHEQVTGNIGQILTILSCILETEQITDGCVGIVLPLVNRIGCKHPDVFTSTLNALPDYQRQRLQNCLLLREDNTLAYHDHP